MTELVELSLAEYAAMLNQAQAGIAALSAARDKRYAEEFSTFAATIVAEIPVIETPTSNYAGHRVQFPVTIDGVEFTASLDLRNVKRSAERKAEKDAAAAAAPEQEKADAKA